MPPAPVVAMRLPSGEIDTEYSAASPPSQDANCLPVAASWMRTRLSSATETTDLPSGANAAA